MTKIWHFRPSYLFNDKKSFIFDLGDTFIIITILFKCLETQTIISVISKKVMEGEEVQNVSQKWCFTSKTYFSNLCNELTIVCTQNGKSVCLIQIIKVQALKWCNLFACITFLKRWKINLKMVKFCVRDMKIVWTKVPTWGTLL